MQNVHLKMGNRNSKCRVEEKISFTTEFLQQDYLKNLHLNRT